MRIILEAVVHSNNGLGLKQTIDLIRGGGIGN